MDLQTVCDELYGLVPADFTAARDARASEARRAGDRQLAAAIKALKRPSAAAWLANLLARQEPARVDELLALGDQLRDAQGRLAGDEMKELSRRGHRVVGELVDLALELAAFAGQRPNTPALRHLQETLDAALADPAAGRDVRAGRLTVALTYAGLGVPGDDVELTANRPDPSDTARSVLAAAEKRIADLNAEMYSAARRRARVHEQIEELDRQMQRIRTQESEVEQQIDHLQVAIAAANQEAEAARRRLGG